MAAVVMPAVGGACLVPVILRARRGRRTWAGSRAACLLVLAACLTGCIIAGCGRQASPAARISIRGGPSLDALFSDLAAAYQKLQPEVRLDTNFTCPPCVLYRRPGERPQVDVFASLGSFEIERVEASGKVQFARQQVVGTTELCLVTSDRVANEVRSIADLHKAQVRRIGIGDPETVGVGHYAKQALEKAGLWKELQPRLILSQSGCELLKWLSLGRDIDAALVFSVCQDEEAGPVRVVRGFPRDLIPPVPLILALTRDATAPEAAWAFMEFCAGPDAQQILKRHRVGAVTAP